MSSTELAIAQDQTGFTPVQVATLSHMGVGNAPEPDLQVFFHMCRRTGLDPFARQIHMIGRNTFDQSSNRWVTKYTIQTGIDGYRLIGHREATKQGETISLPGHEWLHPDGSWRPAWSRAWGVPIAARATVLRNGSPFTAVAMYDEYAQVKKDGSPTQIWAQRPAGQLAKCAEALAWRMAYPQDLAGLHTDDEMGQADNPAPELRQQGESGAERLRAVMRDRQDTPDGPASEEKQEDDLARERARLVADALASRYDLRDPAGVADARQVMSTVVGRDVRTPADLTEEEKLTVLDRLAVVDDHTDNEGDES